MYLLGEDVNGTRAPDMQNDMRYYKRLFSDVMI